MTFIFDVLYIMMYDSQATNLLFSHNFCKYIYIYVMGIYIYYWDIYGSTDTGTVYSVIVGAMPRSGAVSDIDQGSQLHTGTAQNPDQQVV